VHIAIWCPDHVLSRSLDEDRLKTLKTASNPHRLQILDVLSRESSNLGKLARSLGVSRQLTNHHVMILVSAGLVNEDSVGGIKIYGITPKGTEILKELIAPKQVTVSQKETERKTLIHAAPAVVAVLIFLFALYKYATSPEAPTGWLLGGLIAAVIAYVIVSWSLAILAQRMVRNNASSDPREAMERKRIVSSTILEPPFVSALKHCQVIFFQAKSYK